MTIFGNLLKSFLRMLLWMNTEKAHWFSLTQFDDIKYRNAKNVKADADDNNEDFSWQIEQKQKTLQLFAILKVLSSLEGFLLHHRHGDIFQSSHTKKCRAKALCRGIN